jgi:hypothetical protein
MKPLFTAIAALLLASAAQAAETNVVQTINVTGTLLVQNQAVTNNGTITRTATKTPFTTAHLIAGLGQATQNFFTPVADLLLLTPIAGGNSRIVVQDGDNRVDVTALFEVTSEDDLTIDKSNFNTATGVFRGISTEVMELRLRDTGDFEDLPFEFEACGLAMARNKTIFFEGQPIVVNTLSARLVGTGEFDSNDVPFIISLKLSVTGGTVEVIP